MTTLVLLTHILYMLLFPLVNILLLFNWLNSSFIRIQLKRNSSELLWWVDPWLWLRLKEGFPWSFCITDLNVFNRLLLINNNSYNASCELWVGRKEPFFFSFNIIIVWLQSIVIWSLHPLFILFNFFLFKTKTNSIVIWLKSTRESSLFLSYLDHIIFHPNSYHIYTAMHYHYNSRDDIQDRPYIRYIMVHASQDDICKKREKKNENHKFFNFIFDSNFCGEMK